ncbi:MAG: hypothetical protein WD894_00490 [Pirellulales bacterium]
MIELTIEQRHAVSNPHESPPRALDPDTQTTYVLIPEDQYQQIKQLIEGDDEVVDGLYRHAMEVFRREGWDDPSMDVYDELDPRRNS